MPAEKRTDRVATPEETKLLFDISEKKITDEIQEAERENLFQLERMARNVSLYYNNLIQNGIPSVVATRLAAEFQSVLMSM